MDRDDPLRALTKDQNSTRLASGFVTVSAALGAFFWRGGERDVDAITSAMAMPSAPGRTAGPALAILTAVGVNTGTAAVYANVSGPRSPVMRPGRFRASLAPLPHP